MKLELTDMLTDCETELLSIKSIVDANPLDSTTKYLNKYSIIKACGTIEFVFKSIIANYFDRSPMSQVHFFINKNIRESSANPKYDKICSILKTYDPVWCETFKNSVSADAKAGRIKTSLESLVEQRNAFAHGKNTTATIANIYDYYSDAVIILHYLDSAVV